MKTISDEEEPNWLKVSTKFSIIISFICACAAIFMNMIRIGYNKCTKIFPTINQRYHLYVVIWHTYLYIMYACTKNGDLVQRRKWRGGELI